MKPRQPLPLVHWSLLVLGLSCVMLSARAASDSEPASRTCELGITLALLGRSAAAESVFTSLISRSPGDARAFNNLGNLALLRGDAVLALSFYECARLRDTTDAGIRLNQAAALLVLGDEDSASVLAKDGVRRAGSVGAAAHLLGLSYRDSTSRAGRAVPRPVIGHDEMIHLLRAAAARVPKDSMERAPRDTTARPGRNRPTWRPAGARAGASPDLATQIYWKR